MVWFQIYLTRKGSEGHHQARRTREPESTVVVQTGAGEEKKLISNLRPYSRYNLAVSVFNSKGEGPLSEALSFNTPEGGENEKEKTITDANDDSWCLGGRGGGLRLWQSKQHSSGGQLSRGQWEEGKSSTGTDIIEVLANIFDTAAKVYYREFVNSDFNYMGD